MKSFLLIWFGQLISLIGSELTGFALGIWIYERNDSVTQLSLVYLCTLLPELLVSPFAGALVDRWNRRWAMILSDTGAALSTFAIVILLFTNHLEVQYIYLATALTSFFSAFQQPAYIAATTALVPQQHLERAGGLTQIGEAASQLVAPIVAGSLLAIIHIQGILLIDAVTFVFALFTLFLVRIPNIRTTSTPPLGLKPLLREIAEGWTYLIDRPGLRGLLIFSAADTFLTGFVGVLVTPLALSFTSAAVLGMVMSIGGIGMLIGSVVVASVGGPRRLIDGVLSFNLLAGLCIFAAGWHQSIPLLAMSAFIFFFSLPVMTTCSQVIWQKKVPLSMQGRVFALKETVSLICLPIVYLIAGPLADQIFEPLMASDGLFANSLGQWIGVGPGRGIGLMFILMGLLTMLVTGIAYQNPQIRLVETKLPNILPEKE